MTQKEKYFLHFLICVAGIVLLLFSAVNLQEYLNRKSVLGIETETYIAPKISNEERLFWEEFLNKNPDYIPGWIELGRLDKVEEIDPNYIIL